MNYIHQKVVKILTDNFVGEVEDLAGKEMKCINIGTLFTISAGILTGISSGFAFSAGVFDQYYLSYIAGCFTVVALICLKISSVANTQSHYYSEKLKNVLTEDYQFINEFATNPLAMKQIPEPNLPDPNITLKSIDINTENLETQINETYTQKNVQIQKFNHNLLDSNLSDIN